MYFALCIFEAVINICSAIAYIWIPEIIWGFTLTPVATVLEANSISNQLWAAMLLTQSVALFAVVWYRSLIGLRAVYLSMLSGEIFVLIILFAHLDLTLFGAQMLLGNVLLFGVLRIGVLLSLGTEKVKYV